jgi:predicted  nucleic acid-binding Zn-ribbon protein
LVEALPVGQLCLEPARSVARLPGPAVAGRPTNTVHPHVKKLVELQKVDQDISSLTRDIDALPAEELKRRKKLDEFERVMSDRKAKLQKTELDARALDKAVRGSDDEIKRLNERLNIVRNNAEYQATLFQIEAVRKDRDVTQDECLKLIEATETQKVEAITAEAAWAEEKKVFDAFLAEADKLRQSRAGGIAAARERRKPMTEGIPEELLREYDGLYKTRDRQAVSPVENSYCQGCYNKITMNDTAKLMGGSGVVRCGSCQRILYLTR